MPSSSLNRKPELRMLTEEKLDEIVAVISLNILVNITQTPCTGDRGFKIHIYCISENELQRVNVNFLPMCWNSVRNNTAHFHDHVWVRQTKNRSNRNKENCEHFLKQVRYFGTLVEMYYLQNQFPSRLLRESPAKFNFVLNLRCEDVSECCIQN